MCYVTLESVLIKESRGPKHNRLGLSKALHPSSFHCCHLQDPFMYPCVLFPSCAFFSELRDGIYSTSEISVERELSIKERLDECPH